MKRLKKLGIVAIALAILLIFTSVIILGQIPASLQRIEKAFGSTPSDPRWDEACDLNQDGIVDIYDLGWRGKDIAKSPITSEKTGNIYPESGSTIVFVEPNRTIVGTSRTKNFTLSFDVSDTPGLWAYQGNATWDSNVLNLTSATNGTFLSQSGMWDTYFTYHINETQGWVFMGETLYEDPTQKNGTLSSGNGTLAYLNFTILTENLTAYSPINLTDTKLLDYDLNTIVHLSENGEFHQLLGDVDEDGDVDDTDMLAFDTSYGSVLDDGNWNPNCDFNADDKVDPSDLYIISKNYDKKV